jgi:zinc D-Ala-D-Ala carboxypeptidase
MNLSPNFTLREMTDSATAVARGWENVPPPDVMDALRRTAAGLEEVRALLSDIVGHPVPIIITSGYRSLRLNRAIGSRDTSQHVLGEAADFRAPQFGTPAQIVSTIAKSPIQFDQLISESTRSGARWVHISFGPRNRGEVLEINENGTRLFGG